MLFNSLTFWAFFFCVYVLFLFARRNVPVRNGILLCASYFFYGFWDARFLSLILLSTLVDYTIARAIPHAKNKRLLLTTSVALNIGILACFKYFNFFIENASNLLSTIGFQPDWPTLNIILPVGISFYTFQTLSYTIDVYRGAQKPTRNLLNFALFVAFFPQLVAGPIERASRLLPQLESIRPITKECLRIGLYLIVSGLLKKVCIADNAAIIVDGIFAPDARIVGLVGPIGALAFTLQIYADFSGYSDIARGLAKLMGIDLVLNFNLPYTARSPREFWQRWHISLSEWFRDYVYIPLGGNKSGALITLRNLSITMLLVGLWHGSSWTFVAWGFYHGLLLTIHRAWILICDRYKKLKQTFFPLLSWFLCFTSIVIGWALFRAESLSQFFHMMFFNVIHPQTHHQFWMMINAFLYREESELGSKVILLLFLWLPIVVIKHIQKTKGDLLYLAYRSPLIQGALYLLAFYAIVFLSPTGSPFIYFQF